MRCIAFTPGLKRCHLPANKLFCHKHKFWLLKTSIPFIAIVASILTIVAFLKPSNDVDKLARNIIQNMEPEHYSNSNEAGDALLGYLNDKHKYASEIQNALLPQKERNKMLKVIELISLKDIKKAKKVLGSIKNLNPFAVTFKADYKTAILFGEGNYKDALNSVLERNAPLSSIGRRWELAYIIYWFRRNKGLNECEEAIAELKTKYVAGEMSYVWMAVDPGAHSELMTNSGPCPVTIAEAQKDILRYLVEKYPRDKFLDYAYYFLGMYDELIEKFGDSPIIDQAIYAKAYLKYINKIENTADPVSIDVATEVKDELMYFIRRFPRHRYVDDCLEQIGKTFLAVNDTTGVKDSLLIALSQACDLLLSRLTEGECTQLFEAALFPISYACLNADPPKEEIFNEVLKPMVTEDGFIPLRYSLAQLSFENSQYNISLDLYHSLPSEFLENKVGYPDRTRDRIKALESIAEIQDSMGSCEYNLKMAMALKSTRINADRAIPFFDDYSSKCASTSDMPRILMLKAFCYRDTRDGLNMVEQYQKVANEYPNSLLADDALAEIGVYHLLWLNEYEAAREYFNQVVLRYPSGNAVDNCLNWIAYSYLLEGDYKEALLAYNEILKRCPLTRFAQYANKNMEKIARQYGLHSN